MSDFVALIMDVMSVSFTVGSVTLTLGSVAIGMIVLGAGVSFFQRLNDGGNYASDDELDNMFDGRADYRD